MSSDFQIVVKDWLSGDSHIPEFHETSAEIEIKIGGACATLVEDRLAHTVRSSVRVLAMLLSTWLLDNWWRLRWEPSRDFGLSPEGRIDWEMSHSLTAVGGGYDWPPLTMASDGEDISLRCMGNSGNDHPDLSPIRYLNSFAKTISAVDFEHGVANFVQAVIAGLDSRGLRKTPLHDLWKETNRERQHAATESYMKLEALLGLDPNANPALVSGLIKRWQRRVGKSALEEIAANGVVGVEGALQSGEVAAKATKTFADLSELDELRVALANTGTLAKDAPWISARQAAYRLRESWGFSLADPVPTSQIADRLQISEAALQEVHTQAAFPVAVKGPTERKLKFVLNRTHEERRRFDVVRLIGDHLAFESADPWRPATRAVTARQKFQRAFAAEFLCPSEMLVGSFGSTLEADEIDDAVRDTAQKSNVSQLVVRWHLENRKLIHASWMDGSAAPL
jgi:hypothetical protein